MMVIRGLVSQASVCCGQVVMVMVMVVGGGGADVNMENLGKGKRKKKKKSIYLSMSFCHGLRSGWLTLAARCSQPFLGY